MSNSKKFISVTALFLSVLALTIGRSIGNKKYGFRSGYFQVASGIWVTLFTSASGGRITTVINIGHTARISTGFGIYTIMTSPHASAKIWYFN